MEENTEKTGIVEVISEGVSEEEVIRSIPRKKCGNNPSV